MRRTPPLILGGGPAGCAAAITLADGGVAPIVLERSAEDADPLCGGFLSWRTLAGLDRLGIGPLGGQPITRMRLFAGEARVERGLPAPAMGVSRRRLDAAMRARAEASGVRIERAVTAMRWAEGSLHLRDGATLRPTDLFLATGKHDLRGLPRPRPGHGADPMLGLRLRLESAAGLRRLIADAIELHLFDGGYAGLVMQEDSANLCLAVRKSRIDAAGGIDAFIASLGRYPYLAARLTWRRAGRIEAVANVPYGWRASTTDPGVWRLGDQGGVITSLAGEGMGIAVATGVDAARTWLRGVGATDYQRATARRLARPLAIAGLVGQLGMAPATAALLIQAARVPGAARLFARATRVSHP